ncbi:MAG TPA: alkaline phosphatase family protein [Hyphomicrobiaceae bacterium]|nr:alkaline phosphatase family protein [Hyphomicrobiaceae bacterium]
MRRVVVVVLDGMRRDQILQANTPGLVRFAGRAQSFVEHRSMFPSATRVVSASFATGCLPARHELQGNSLALLEDGRLVQHDAGHPDFLQHKRRVTGRALAVPTLAERLAPIGGMILFSNVSPGAAYAHDPDGFGYVYHRAGSYAPGRKRLEGTQALTIAQDAAGERLMTERFMREVLIERSPPLAVLWLGEPDATQHLQPLGSPAQLAAVAQADGNAARVIAAVDALRARGDDVLLIVCSDHGHQSVSRVVDIEAELIAAGLKDGRESTDVVTPTSGTSTLIYVAANCADRIGAIGAFLLSRDWVDRVVGPDELGAVGQAADHGLAFAISLKSDDEPNAFGVRGRSVEARPAAGKADHLGCGQHGGLARYEQMPFLMIEGPGFGAGSTARTPTSPIDLAPTILAHLDQPQTGMDGRALQAPGGR